MSTNPSSRTRIAYGSSLVDNLDNSKSKRITTRRDSTAPLINTPPISVSLGEDPLDAGNTRPYRHGTIGISGSYARHHGGSSRMALRRRRNSESSSNDEDGDDEDDDLVDKNVELNTSDEEQTDSEDDSEDSDHLQTDNEDHIITNITKNDVRISGLNEVPEDTCSDQLLLLEEEDVQILIQGYKFLKLNLLFYRISCILSFGLVWLVCRWVPRWYISWVGLKVSLQDAEWLVFKVFIYTYIL